MKFLHLGDLHLGKRLKEFDLYDDQKYMIDKIAQEIKKNNIDAVLVSGDVYDTTNPGTDAVNLLDYFLKTISAGNTKIFMISGNHDSDDRLNFGSKLFEDSGIYIETKYNKKIRKCTLSDEFGPINIYLLPFVKRSYIAEIFDKKNEIKSYDDAFKLIFSEEKINTSERNIILSHQFVSGNGVNPETSGSENDTVLRVGTLDSISTDHYKDFDYAALGHIHSSQSIGKENIRYSGSLLTYSLAETEKEKRFPVIEIKEKNNISYSYISPEPKRKVRRIKGLIADIIANPENTDDFVYFEFEDSDIIENTSGVIRNYYPNTLGYKYVNVKFGNDYTISDSENKLKKSFEDNCREFYEYIYGDEISDDEMKLLLEVGKAVGLYEAD